MRLLFLSSDPISLPCLRAVARGSIDGLEISGVVTNPDRKRGRGKKIQRNPVAEEAEKLGLPTLQMGRLTADRLARFVSFEAALVFAFGQILPAKILGMRPDLFFNFHASPLPRLRGASPIETAIAEGWKETEICLMRMTRAMDAGAVGDRISVPIGSFDTGPDLREKISFAAVSLLPSLTPARLNSLAWEEQDHGRATFCRKLTKADAFIDFSLPAADIVDRSRAFAGWPGTSLRLLGEEMKTEDLRAVEGKGRAGEILEVGDRLIVAAGQGAVSIGRVQRPTRRMIPFPEYQKQAALCPGEKIGFRLSQPLVRRF